MPRADRLARAVPLAVAALTTLVFAPVLGNGFVDWDDQVNLTGNLAFRGLDWAHLRWMLTTTLMGHYIPVTWLSFALDHALWGMNPAGYHLTSVLLHAVTAGLVCLVAARLLARAQPDEPAGRRWAGAALAALAFGLHPLRVESVAWATERRDVLSGALFVAAVLAYLAAVESPPARRRRLAVALGFFALAALAKSTVMTLPLVLLVLDVYPLRRLGGADPGWTGPAARRVLLEKAPFLAVGLATAAVALWAVARGGLLRPAELLGPLARAAVAAHAAVFYVVKTALPVGLSPLYELPARVDPLEPRFALSAALVAGLSVVLWRARRRWPAGLAAWAAYGILLAPVSGLVHVGYQLAHDRYSYLSCLGPALLVGGVPGLLARGRKAGRVRPRLVPALHAALALWLAGLAALTWLQIPAWESTESLWTRAVDAQPDCALCHDELGGTLAGAGRPAEAVPHFRRALALRPGWTRTEGALGVALVRAGRPAEAEPALARAVLAHPDDVPFLYQLGVARVRLGRFAAAVEPLRHAAGLRPAAADVHAALARAHLGAGERDRAREAFEAARRLDPAVAAPLAGAFTARAP